MASREKLMEVLLQSMNSMRHRVMVGYMAKQKMEITPAQGCVLRFVERHESPSVKAIAQALHISSSAATQLIDGLVAKGYLLRKEGTGDRRVSVLSLSKKAQTPFLEFKAQGLKKMTELFKVLTDDELAQYAALTEKIANPISLKL